MNLFKKNPPLAEKRRGKVTDGEDGEDERGGGGLALLVSNTDFKSPPLAEKRREKATDEEDEEDGKGGGGLTNALKRISRKILALAEESKDHMKMVFFSYPC